MAKEEGESEGVCRFENHSFVSCLILEEIQANHMDLITVVCQDGEVVKASSTLLAALSPFLARLLKPLEQEEIILYVPDVEASTLNTLFSFVLNKGKMASSLSDCDSIAKLDGIFWRVNNIMKQETIEDFLEDLVSPNVRYDEKMEAMDDLMMEEDLEKEKKVIEMALSKIIQSNDGTKRKKRGRSLQESKKSKKKKAMKVNKHSSDEEDGDRDDMFGWGDVSSFDQNDADDNSNSDTENFTGPGKHDPDFDVDHIKKEEKVKKVKKKYKTSKRKLERKAANEAQAKEILFEDSIVNSEEFLVAQANLLKDLEDPYNLEDPYLVWCKYHDLNPQLHDLKHQNKEVKLICPQCYERFPSSMGGKKFFNHMRDHKYSSYKCICKPQDDNASSEAKHLQLEHWHWKQCDQCSSAVQPSKYSMHLFYKHKDKMALQCYDCCKTLKSRSNYWDHMDKHHAEKIMCGCTNIIFRNLAHRKHHIQVYHKKEKLGCDKCYFLCSTDAELAEHVQEKHVKKELEEKAKPSVICDICGQEMKSKNPAILKDHKARVHDPVLVQCTQCPGKYTAAGLKQHMRRCHSEGVCNICGIKVKQLIRHMNVMHGSVESSKYKCEYCTKVFHYKHQLKTHTMNVHLKERPYKCRYGCDMAYNDSSNRNAHERRRHGQRFTGSVLNKVVDEGGPPPSAVPTLPNEDPLSL
eukprot:TRINITY_DN11742_c0_g1_i3.p1 TRINITY_DN11742_c0_g1~~TRINITY_DN11742_c0_g1_i3.p1  ORF type:complete len:692 (-),score=148.60 TRINITY_DN11742_c0_g1_i3:146-2221(-)